jgi:hypothetical protein
MSHLDDLQVALLFNNIYFALLVPYAFPKKFLWGIILEGHKENLFVKEIFKVSS